MCAARADEDRHADALAGWMEAGDATYVTAGTTLDALPPDQLCFVKDGWLLRQRRLPDDCFATLGVHLPGDAPLLDVCFGAPPLDTLFALSDVELSCRSLADFRSAAGRDPELLSAVLARLAYDAALLREGMAAIGRMNAQERLVTFLYQTRQRLVLCERLDSSAHTFDLPMTQLHLAKVIGITSVHVNRVLRALRTASVLTMANNRVEVADWEAFARIGSTVVR